jgi:GAF domain-containing protein
MSATYVLATEDPDLLRAWWVLVPAGRQVLTLDELNGPTSVPAGVPTLVVLDVTAADRLPPAYKSCPTIAVGEPGSSVLERVRAAGYAKALLSYDESRLRLGMLFPLIEEIAERGAALELASERAKRSQYGRTEVSRDSSPGTQAWSTFEEAVEHLGVRARMLDEFRKIVRATLNTSSVSFFLKDGNCFRSDRGDAVCNSDDPLCLFWSTYPSVLDGSEWPHLIDAVTEISVRQRLRHWGARLLVPLHDNARILGFIALGVRDDGIPYDSADKNKAVALGKLLRQLLEQSRRLEELTQQNDRWRLAEHYLPNVLVLGPDEVAPKHVPSAVRSLIADVRGTGESRKLTPTPDQPFRATGGLVSENLGVWVYWEDASVELRETLQRERAARLLLLHDIALTLNHELGNALVSLAALRHGANAEPISPVMLGAVKKDIASLENINRHLASIPTFREVEPEEADVRLLLREVARKTGIGLEGTGPSVMLSVVPKLVEFALESIVESIAENRPELGKRELAFRLRSMGDGEQLTAQILIKGPKLALEGIWPTPAPGDVPSHGRISVFIAKEIIRLHGGDIRANQTTLGTEISITLRNW